MTEQPMPEMQNEPELRHTKDQPRGVLQKNLKTLVYLGAAVLVIVAAIFSSSGKKTPAQQAAAKGQPPQPMIQDNTDNNVQDLKNQLQTERQKEQQQAAIAAPPLGIPLLRPIRAHVQRRLSRPPPHPMVLPALPRRVFRASPARRRSRAMSSHNLLPSSSRHNRLPRRIASGPTIPALPPTLCTLVFPTSRSSRIRHSSKYRVQQCLPVSVSRKWPRSSRAPGEHAGDPEGYKRPWRPTLIRPQVSRIWFTKARSSTPF